MHFMECMHGHMTGCEKTAGLVENLLLDQRGDGLYSGTFRWDESKQFPSLLPVRDQVLYLSYWQDCHKLQKKDEVGWKSWLRVRDQAAAAPLGMGTKNLVQQALDDPSFLDGLSFPVSLVHLVHLLKLQPPFCQRDAPQVWHIVVMGATTKAEQRIYRITNYWMEIGHAFPEYTMRVYFVGPEVVECQSMASTTRSTTSTMKNMQFSSFRGTTGDFLRKHTFINSTNATLIGYNTGFGNFVESMRFDLFWSWLPDLYSILDSNIPSIFLCANDYADMQGEFGIQLNVLGAKFIMLPRDNPFSAASHLHEEGKQDTSWSRANSFSYVIQGYSNGKPVQRLDTQSRNRQLELEVCLNRRLSNCHLVDSLGRHLYKGTILSKEQARAYDLCMTQSMNKATHLPSFVDTIDRKEITKQTSEMATMDKSTATTGNALSVDVVDAMSITTFVHGVTVKKCTKTSEQQLIFSIPNVASMQELHLEVSPHHELRLTWLRTHEVYSMNLSKFVPKHFQLVKASFKKRLHLLIIAFLPILTTEDC